MDANGNYGYKKVGADTVTPFSPPLEIGCHLQGYASCCISCIGYRKAGLVMKSSDHNSGITLSGGDTLNWNNNGTSFYGTKIGVVTTLNAESIFDISGCNFVQIENTQYHNQAGVLRLFN